MFPKGFASMGHDSIDSRILVLDGQRMSEPQCLQKCCALGSQKCQHLWFFKDKCFALACSLNSNNCDPQSVPANVPPSVSTYVHIQYNRVGSLPDTRLPPATTPPTVMSPSSYEDDSLHAVISPSAVVTWESDVYLSARNSSSKQQVSTCM